LAYVDGGHTDRETQPVPKYDGIVNLDQDEVEVIIGLDPDRVHLRAGDLDIGDWAPDECAIAHLGEGVYAITAENESLRFVPRDARLFEAGLNHGTGYGLGPAPKQDESQTRRGRHSKTVRGRETPPAHGEPLAPPPKPLTLILFYGLAGVTAALGVWALLSIF
jgi:hypothetical protein